MSVPVLVVGGAELYLSSEVRARDGSGVKLTDQSGTLGLTVNDGGTVTVSKAVTIAADDGALTIGSGAAVANYISLNGRILLYNGNSYGVVQATGSRPLYLAANSITPGTATKYAMVDTGGNFGVMTDVFGTGAAGIAAIQDGTMPSTFPANKIQIGSKKTTSSPNRSTIALMTEQQATADVALASTHSLRVWVNIAGTLTEVKIPMTTV